MIKKPQPVVLPQLGPYEALRDSLTARMNRLYDAAALLSIMQKAEPEDNSLDRTIRMAEEIVLETIHDLDQLYGDMAPAKVFGDRHV